MTRGKFTQIFPALLGVLGLAWGLSGCDERPQPVPVVAQPDPATLVRAIYAPQIILDPHFAYTAAESAPARDLFVGLMTFNAKGEIVPAVAQQWLSEDGKEWLFLLDEWAQWSNHAPVTAEDFVASWQRLADPKNGAKLARYLVYMGVKNAKAVLAGELPVSALGVEAVNPHSLKITLEKPNFALPKMLAHSALLPSYQGKAPTASPILPTNGAYRLQAASPRALHLQAQAPTAFFNTVKYEWLLEKQTANGVDLVENPPAHLQANRQLPRPCVYYYEFNFADPQLQQKAVRQAISALVGTINWQGYGVPNNTILPRAMQSSAETQWQGAIVEQLLSQGGVSVQQPLRLALAYDNRTPHAQIAGLLIRTLGQSDLVKITPKPLDRQGWLKTREQRQFQIARAGWCADFPDAAEFVRHFHSQSPDNKMHYHNAEVDALIQQLDETQEANARLQLAQKIDQLVRQDVAVLPLFQLQRRIVATPTLLGIDPNNASETIYSKDLLRLQPTEETNEPAE